jgi:hypothetical protein
VFAQVVLDLLDERAFGRGGLQVLLGHAIEAGRPGAGIGENACKRRVNPFLLTDDPIEMVKSMPGLVHRFRGKAPLGFDDIGHTS